MKPELLSPVGNKEMLKQAIHNGADAVYLSGKSYGARKYAQNFDNDELKQVVEYAHLYGVKVYITVNTLIYNDEVDDFVNYIRYLQTIFIDAIIMQDIGMIDYIHTVFPNIEIHASTQCHIYNGETVLFLNKLGASRVVLAREMDIESISKLPKNVEKEVFIHGALCVSYSGRCLFSSMNGGRSANRGQCVACCRFPFKLYMGNQEIKTTKKYLLSMKDLNVSENIDIILNKDIDCLKIEGRMKSPEYVGYMTKIYRKLIDNYYRNKNNEEKLTKEEKDNIKQLFNRKFTEGFILGNKENINNNLQNNEGVYLGEVIDYTSLFIKIKLKDTLSQEDGIKFYNNDKGMIVNKIYDNHKKLVNKGQKDEIIFLENKVGLNTKDLVYKTISMELNKKLEKYKEKKIPIIIKVFVEENGDFILSFNDGINEVEVKETIVQKSNNHITTKKEIIANINRLGNTIYEPSNIDIDYKEDKFIPKSKINELRRKAVELLDFKRIYRENNNSIGKYKQFFKNYNNNIIEINVLVRNENQLNVVKELVDNIYIEDYELYNKYKENKKVIYKTSGIENEYMTIKNERILASDWGAIEKYSNDNYVIGDYMLNVTNDYSLYTLERQGVKKICLSPENNVQRIKKFDTNINIELLVYGKVKLMSLKVCPKKEIIKDCNLCKTKEFYLSHHQNKYKVLSNNCNTSIMDYKNIDKIDIIHEFKSNNIYKYRIDLLDENEIEIKEIISRIRKEIDYE